MTALVDLALRAIAAGAPVGSRHAVTVVARDTVSGTIGRDVEGKAYLLATDDGGATMSWMPLLSDSSWLGWTLAEVRRRGWHYSIDAVDGRYVATVTRPDRDGYGWDRGSPAECLVAMLEATLPPADPSKPTTP